MDKDLDTKEKILAGIKEHIGEDELVQRKLEGRCPLCGEPDDKHYFTCPEMSHFRYMYGEHFALGED